MSQMDSLEVDLKSQAAGSSVSNTDSNRSDEGQKGACVNVNATSNYLSIISRHKGLLTESHARTFTQLQGSLNGYITDQNSIQSTPFDADSAQIGHYRKLTVAVINRDPELQEKVAQALSTSKTLVRSKDASTVLETDLKKLPKPLSEGSAAGKNLSKFICQSVVNLTDSQNMGAGLQRDLAIRDVYLPEEKLSLRQNQATSEALNASIAYVKSNQPEILEKLDKVQTINKIVPGSTKPQIMTRYLRQALDEFPEDSTYLDIFKKNKENASSKETETEVPDEISKDTSKRIRELIMKAAQSARRGNLIPPSKDAQNNTQPVAQSVKDTENTKAQSQTQNISRAEDSSVDASKLSLSELSARAAKLQAQFREERQRIVNEGKLPDPAPKAAPIQETKKTEIAEITQTASARPALDNSVNALSADDIRELARQAVKEAIAETIKLSLEQTKNSAKEAATEAVSELKSSLLEQIAKNNDLVKESTSLAVKQALSETSQIKGATQQAIDELKAAMQSKIEESNNSFKETRQAVLDIQKNVQEQLATKGSENIDSNVIKELKNTFISELQDTKEQVKEAFKQTVKDQMLASAKNQHDSVYQIKNIEDTKDTSEYNHDTKVSDYAKTSLNASAKALSPSTLSESLHSDAVQSEVMQKTKEFSEHENLLNKASDTKVTDDLTENQQKVIQSEKQNSQIKAELYEELKNTDETLDEAHTVKNDSSANENEKTAFSSDTSDKKSESLKENQINTKTTNVQDDNDPSVNQNISIDNLTAKLLGAADNKTDTAQTVKANTDSLNKMQSLYTASFDNEQTKQQTQTEATAQNNIAATANSSVQDVNEDSDQIQKQVQNSQANSKQTSYTLPPVDTQDTPADDVTNESAKIPVQQHTQKEPPKSTADVAVQADNKIPVNNTFEHNPAVTYTEENFFDNNNTSMRVVNPFNNTTTTIDESAFSKIEGKNNSFNIKNMPEFNASVSDVKNATQSADQDPSFELYKSTDQQGDLEYASLKKPSIFTTDKPFTAQPPKTDAENAVKNSGISNSPEKVSEKVNSSSLDQTVKPDSTNIQQTDVKTGSADSTAFVDSRNNNRLTEFSTKMLLGTIPSNELEDSVVPSDVLKESDSEFSHISAKKTDSISEELKISAVPEKTAGAAAITQGNEEPIPEKSVVQEVDEVKEKSSILSKLSSLFSSKKAHKVEVHTDSAVNPENMTVTLNSNYPKGSPLDYFTNELKIQLSNTALPQKLRDEAKNLLDKLSDPVKDLPSVSNWLNFTQGPMSPSSTQALAMHQWAFLLLAIRFSQLGKSVDSFLKKAVDLDDDAADFDHELSKDAEKILKEESKHTVSSLIDKTFEQISRMQNPNRDNLPVMFQYVPLPPNYDGGKEGGFNAYPVVEEDGKKAWHLNFAFDLKDIGAVEIKAVAKLPEIKIAVIAENMQGLERVQNELPKLQKTLQDIGITTRSVSTRLGTIHMNNSQENSFSAADNGRKLNETFSVDA